MRISTRFAIVAAVACLAPSALADNDAPAPTAASTPVFTLDAKKQGSFDAIQQLRSAKSSIDFSKVLSNNTAAQMAVIESMGIALIAGFEGMGEKQPDPNLSKDLMAYLNGYGLNEKTMPKNSLANLPASAALHGREMLAGIAPFELRAEKLSTDSKMTAPAAGWPADQSGYKMTDLGPDAVKVTVIGPNTAVQMPKTFTTKYEDGAWRVDLGDLTKMAQVTPSNGPSTSYPKTPGAAAAKLFDAVKNDDIHGIKVILNSHPALIEARDDQGQTPLIAVGFWDHLDVAQFLVAHHASVNAHDNTGTTALMQAASFDHLETAQLLIAHGAAVNQKDDFGHTALDQAKQMKNDDVEKLLVSHGGK